MALDFGRTAFKLALLELQDSALRVRQVRIVELSQPADAEIRKAALRSLLEGIVVERAEQVVSIVDDSFACVRQIQVPRMPARELPGAVRWELQRFLAIPPEEMQVDYEVIGETGSERDRKLCLVAAAIPAGMVQEHLKFLEQAGVKPTQLIPKATAISAWAARFRKDQGPMAVLELGVGGSEFIVAEAGQLLFTRKIPVGSADLTRSMTGVLMTSQGQVGLTEAEAEALKRGVGIPGHGASSEALSKGISRTQLLSLIRGILERLASEVERSLAFYGESTCRGGIEELFLVGGGAHLKGLAPWLQEQMGIHRVTTPNPLDGTEVLPGALSADAAAMSLSLVPVLGAGARAGGGLNLLPAEFKEAARLRLQRAAAIGAGTAFVIGLSLFWIGLQVYRHSLSKQVNALRLEQTAVQATLPMAQAAVNAQEQLIQEPEWEELFRRLSLLIPPEIYLTELRMEGRSVVLRGRIRRATSSPDETLARFMQSLREDLLAEFRLRHSRRLEGSSAAAEFEVDGVLP